MEDMGELQDQQITDSPVGSSHSDLISPHDLSPSISRAAVAVSVSSMMDVSDFRSQMSEPTYQTLNGRMSPVFTSATSYATLTPLQPLPPISTVSDKFSHYGHPGNVSGSFTLMQNNGLGMGLNAYQYEKLSGLSGLGMSPPHYSSSGNGSLGMGLSVGQPPSPLSPHSGVSVYSQNGMHSPTKSLSPNGYDTSYATHRDLTRVLGQVSPQSPVSMHISSSPGGMPSLNGLHTPHTPPSHLPPPGPSTPPTTREANIPSSNSSTPIGIITGGGAGGGTIIVGHGNNDGIGACGLLNGNVGMGGGVVVSSTTAAAQAAAVAAAAAAAAVAAAAADGVTSGGLSTVGIGSSASCVTPQSTVVGVISAGSKVNGGSVGLSGSVVSVGGTNGVPVGAGVNGGAISVCNTNINTSNSNTAVTSNNNNNSNSNNNSSASINNNNNNSSNSSAGEVEEINTKELAQRISAELKRYSIPQAIFAQRVLCRSQGTLSDLLRNPKPWSKLKSGRETFRRMWKWLQEPEFQRMSALRLAGKASCRKSYQL